MTTYDYTPEEMDEWVEQETVRREYQQLLAEQASDERDAALDERISLVTEFPELWSAA